MRSERSRAFSWVVAASLSLLAAGCGTIQVLGDGGAGGGGVAGHGGAGAGGSGGSGGHVGGSGGSTRTGGTNGGVGGRVGSVDASPDSGLCACPAIFQPVCGVNGKTYWYSCEAGCAGVAVAYTGACVDAGVDAASCSVAAGCCARDSDCIRNQECAGNNVCPSTGAKATGVCKTRPQAAGQCWTDSDCPTGGTCSGASVCPCGSACLLADRMGTCGA
jgi:hypothetical protein